MKLVAVNAEKLDQWLDDIAPALDSFADRSRGRFTPQYFIDGIRSRHKQLWIVEGEQVMAVALTQVNDDEMNTVSITHCAGHNARAWVHLIDNIKGWARERGSRRIEAITRPGWERLLEPKGFKKTHVVLEVDV